MELFEAWSVALFLVSAGLLVAARWSNVRAEANRRLGASLIADLDARLALAETANQDLAVLLAVRQSESLPKFLEVLNVLVEADWVLNDPPRLQLYIDLHRLLSGDYVLCASSTHGSEDEPESAGLSVTT